MRRFLICILALGLSFSACKKEEDDEPIGPVWILNVTARDGSRTDQAMQSCARVVWTYAGQSDYRVTECRHNNSFVKVWEGISEDVRIFYHVEADGYGSSGETYADFIYAQVDSTTESGNPEVVINRDVTLFPN